LVTSDGDFTPVIVLRLIEMGLDPDDKIAMILGVTVEWIRSLR